MLRLEQDCEPRLFEVVIGGEGFVEAVFFHHHERNAIGERLFLVRALQIEVGAATP